MRTKCESGARHLKAWLPACLLLLAAMPVLAQSGGGYDLGWNSVDSGGTTFSTAGVYSLGGTAGQPDAAVMSGGTYTLSGGFWPGGAPPAIGVFLPVVVRTYP